MNITQKSRRTERAVSMLVALVIGFGVGGGVAYVTEKAVAEPKTASGAAVPVVSMFEFTGLDGWRQGPSNETSMVLFGNARDDGTSSCFVSAQYEPGVVDVSKRLARAQRDVTAEKLPSASGVLKTEQGDKPYELHQFHVSGTGDIELMGGLGLGYVQLARGYVQLEAHCNTHEELASAVVALQSYRVAR